MSEQVSPELVSLLRKILRADDQAKIPLLEQAITMADNERNISLAASLRLEMVRAANGLADQKAIAALNWCLREYDRHPAELADQLEEILWCYKWVATSLPDFPDITPQAMDGMWNDMAERYTRCGFNHHVIAGKRCEVALKMGRLDEARQWAKQWQSTPRDKSADCEACEADTTVWFNIVLGQLPEALDAAAPILRGKLKCSEVPARTWCSLLVPLLKLGRVGDAVRYQRKAIRRTLKLDCVLSNLGDHFAFFALTCQPEKGARYLASHLSAAMATKSLLQRLDFLRGAALLAHQAKRQGLGDRALPLTASVDVPQPHTFAAFADWARAHCQTLAAQFDQRNGNTYYASLLAAHDDLLQLARPLSFRHRYLPF